MFEDSPERFDAFGNPIDIVVGYARGSILRTSVDEARRLRRAQAITGRRVGALGPDAVAVFTGNTRGFPVKAADLAALCEEWVGPGLFGDHLEQAAIDHLGGRPRDATAVFNRTSAGIIAAVESMAGNQPVVSVVPPGGRSHASLVRGARLAHVPLRDIAVDGDWETAIDQLRPKLVIITTVTSSLERLADDASLASVARARAAGAVTLLDEAYGARLRPVLHGGLKSLELGADLTITNCDKAGLPGPRAGVMSGRASLVARVAAWASEHGMEARAPIALGALRSLQAFTPDTLVEESEGGRQLHAALAARFGGTAIRRTDLGPMIHEDDLLALVLDRAGRRADPPAVVPCEATAALGMLLLEEHGILTVNTHGQPGARVSLRLKPTLDALARLGGAADVAEAIDRAVDRLATSIHERDAVADLVVGSPA